MWNSKQIEYLKNTAVRSLVGDSGEFEFNGADVLTFLEGTTPVTEDQITTEMVRIQAEYDSLAYSRSRASSYPSTGDQLDMIMKDKRDGTTTHQTACEAVKTQFPKG